MRHLLIAAILGVAVPLLPGKALMLSVNPEPGSFSEVDSEINRIKSDLGGAQCGGWDWFTPVSPHIPNVWGVPGHQAADPLGHIRSGMALREETGGVSDGPIANKGFEWAPTWGFTSACRPGWPGFYEVHPCQRPAGGIMGFAGPKIFKPPSLGGNTVDPFDGVSWTCDALCEDLNRRWIYDQYKEYCTICDSTGACSDVFAGYRDTVCYDTDTQPPPPAPTPSASNCYVVFFQYMECCTRSPVGGAFPNCKMCADDECRQELPSPGSTYKSYYRQFMGSCTRDPVAVVPDDDHERLGVPVSCYGLYDEFDPKTRVTGPMDRHCVIANTYPGRDHDFLEMPQTQVTDFSQAEYGQTLAGTDWPDPPDASYQIVRDPAFDVNTDLWYPNISGGFSLVNGKVLDEVLDNDITYALMAPDSTEFKSYPQLNEEQMFSSGAFMRAFDDSVSNDRWERRTVAEWWQDIEFESHKLFSPPLVRLLLPPTWSVGLDPLDPFFSPELPGPSSSPDPRLEPLEVQLKVRDDLLGDVAGYMERSLILRLQEEAVPVLIPLGSPTEYRVKAHAWCVWYMQRNNMDNCDSAGGSVGDLILRLEEYADQLDSFRELRGELYRYQAKLLEDQNDIISAIGNWLNTNMSQYVSYSNSLVFLNGLQGLWQNAQNVYRTYHDITNLPWCMQQRYTTPIYSMLDDFNWFPGRPELDGCMDDPPTIGDGNCFPRFETEMIPDAVLDFSLLRTATGAMRLPVLKPVQVSLARFELDPPNPTPPSPHIPELPPLPPIPTIYADVIDQLPDVVIEKPPPTINSFFPAAAPTVDPAVYGRAFDILMRMNNAYLKYWESLKLDPAAVVDGTEEDCLFPDQQPCVHVEMDLIERFVRMCSRPAVFLKEDFYKPGATDDPLGRPIDQFIIDFDECPGNEDPRLPQRWNWACQPLNQQKFHTQRGWGLRTPDEKTQEEFISGFREQMFKETLLREGVPEEDKLRFFVDPDDITPSFETMGTTELIPKAGSSSSSSSP
ncbi:hypothetical protein COU79_04310 [Candidatus Peregrinibacteria bacterium CG10_big_fil_rev_8_21_14_0_10_54_7]|nr:MAG: hypothetical protein COU79_04310 [Candidatus Peregrinibacteria bacterium CG10_big_fil_rev_8_21_14_0_10_54_7]